ncbi:hypothetical protein FRC10_008586 [Ceratobasidium sp. 414]|nr:hypothetical protein FRC10_008586 [Ceratobasidium sp. 414]
MAWDCTCDWDEDSEVNPIWDLLNMPLMGEHVMDQVCAYLVHSSTQACSRSQRRLCLVPASLSGAVMQIEGAGHGVEAWIQKTGPGAMSQLVTQRSMVWTASQEPTFVLIPVINHLQVHCYLWFGSVKQRPGAPIYDLELFLLDSLPRVTNRELQSRLAFCRSVLGFLLPQINGDITGSHLEVPGYRQAPGTTDCGYFVCQAISALAHDRRPALYTLTPVEQVKKNVLHILEECRSGALHMLAAGSVIDHPIMLHPLPYAPPPWWPKTKEAAPAPTIPNFKQWVPPKMERSLSEPRCQLGLGSWEEVLGPRADVLFEEVSGEAFQGYLAAITCGKYDAPTGLLSGVGGGLPEGLMGALLLEGHSASLDWAPEAESSSGSDEEGLGNPSGGVGVRRFLQGISSLPAGHIRSKAVFTGEHLNHPLHLNWVKETVDLDQDWLTAGLDIDSLSLTASDPKFTSTITMHPYPPQSSTLTTHNGLSVDINGCAKKLSHIPNLTFAHVGSHNQFRINVFFPHYEKGQNNARQYITMMNDEDFTLWYNEVVWQAICRVELLCPPEYRHAATCLRQSLPTTYKNAKVHARGGQESKGHKILPELFSLVLHYARLIVERSPRLQKLRGFFLHIWGTNLKAVGHEIHRQAGNALLHIFKSFPIVDWSLQNPRDIAVDVGLELNIRQEMLPDDIDGLTLLWKLSPLKQLAKHGWRKAHIDAYTHSHVVGGISAAPRASIRSSFYYIHAYMKDKVLTYRHRDSSIGTGYSPQDGLQNSQRYTQDISRLRETLLTSPGSFGVRIEWRCGVQAANQILSLNPAVWVERFMHSNTLVALRTSDIVKLKLVFMDSYEWLFSRLQQLRPSKRTSEAVLLMAVVLTYLGHGLVQRPDEMSSSRFMAKSLDIMSRVRRFGFASVPMERLSEDLLGMHGSLSLEDYKVLQYTARKNPAGARIKTSRLPVTKGPEIDHSHTHNHTQATLSNATVFTVTDDLTWVPKLVNQTLAPWIWGQINEGDKRAGLGPSAFHGPLLLSRWKNCADVGVRSLVRPSANGFHKVQANFIPNNWVLLGRGKIWQTLDELFFDQIRERISVVDSRNQLVYSKRIHAAIADVLRTWEYLPCAQKDRIWSYTGSGRTKSYMLYHNPAFLRTV